MLRVILLAVLAFTMATFTQYAFAQQQGILHIAFGKAGLTSLNYAGTELLSGGFQVKDLMLANWEGVSKEAGLREAKVLVDRKKHTITQQSADATISCAYTVKANKLEMTITVANTSKQVLQSLLLQPLALKFPPAITGFDGGFRKAHNVGEPPVVGLDYGRGVLTLVNDEVGRPLFIGFPKDIDDKQVGVSYPVLVSNAKNAIFPAKSSVYTQYWLDNPNIDRPVYPGQVDTYHISLRFGPAGTSVAELAKDVYHNFVAAYPRTLKWDDRRPIAQLFVGGTVDPKTNPRGYRMTPASGISTPEELVTFKQNLLNYADSCIRILKDMNAQGMILWDIEGYELSWGTYIGDPRSLAPEMDAAADAFFQRFRDAGLRVGLTLRPQFPGRYGYSNNGIQAELLDPAYMLNAKLEYAKNRWGCTLFYVDSNADFNEFGKANDEGAYQLISAEVFKKVAQMHPDVLIMPEHENSRYYAYTAPYNECRQGYFNTPIYTQRAYPDAFCAISLAGYDEKILDQRHDDFLAAIKRGDIFLFNGWYSSPQLDKLKAIYKEAGK